MPKRASACAIKWVTVLLFGTTACIPAERASGYSWGNSCVVSSMSQTLGRILMRSGAASRPFITGIDISMTIRSGRRLGAFSIASLPCSASPQTTKFGCESNKGRTAHRIVALSSTRSTFFLGIVSPVEYCFDNGLAALPNKSGRRSVKRRPLHRSE
jgi:hypothetical protein